MSDTPDVPRLSSYPILPPATRVRIRNRLTRSLEAVNELLTSARDNAAALDAVSVTAGQAILTLPAQSVTTLRAGIASPQ